MLEAATPANISICLCGHELPDRIRRRGIGNLVLRPEYNVADLPCCIAEVVLQLDAVVQTHNRRNRAA